MPPKKRICETWDYTENSFLNNHIANCVAYSKKVREISKQVILWCFRRALYLWIIINKRK